MEPTSMREANQKEQLHNPMEGKLQEVRVWAKVKIRSRAEPPNAWFLYMKLVETLDQMLDGAQHVKVGASIESEGDQS